MKWSQMSPRREGRLLLSTEIAPGFPFPCLAPTCFAAARHCSLKKAAVLLHHGPRPVFGSRVRVCNPAEGLASAL